MEVIHDRQNGLVVPAGDIEALAGALRSVIEDEALRKDLTPAPGSCVLRSVAAQVDDLEMLYAELQARAPGLPAPAAGDVRHVLFVVGIEGAPLRYRARLPEEALALRGVQAEVRYYRSDDVPRLAAAADAIVLYRVPATVQILELIESIRARPEPVPVLYDIDDLVFDPDLHHEIDPLLKDLPKIDRDRYWEGVRRYRTTLEHCDAYVGSTEALCAAATEAAGIPSHRFANGVGLQLARVSDLAPRRPRRAGPLRIGYFSGTNTHNEDWAAIEPAVLDVLRRHPDVELWLGGLLEPGPGIRALGRRVVRLPMVPWYELPANLRDVDVNLAPLTLGGRFNDAKSAIKWLEAALVGTPTIATPTEPFVEAVEDGVTGLLATTPSDWADHLTWLLEDHAARHRLGQNARRAVLLRWSPDRQADRYLEILRTAREQVAKHGHRTPSSTWSDVVLDEPYLAFALERYMLPPNFLDGRRSLSRVAVDYYARGRDHLAEHGAAATLRKAAAVMGRSPRRVAGRLNPRRGGR
jgi:glycosyltransferase involved in cell wall biosynthesis